MHANTPYSTGEEGVEKELLSQFLLPSITLCYHIRRCLKQYIGLWLSLVERCVRDAEAAGSNPVNPTRNCRSAVRGWPFSFPVWVQSEHKRLRAENPHFASRGQHAFGASLELF